MSSRIGKWVWVLAVGFAVGASGAPRGRDAALRLGERIVRERVEAGAWGERMLRGDRPRAGGVEAFMSGAVTLGYVVSVVPVGFVLVRGDDRLPGWKVLSERCGFEELPEGFVEVMKRELEEEMGWLVGQSERAEGLNESWGLEGLSGEKGTVGPLLTLNWNQDYPYNMYAPVASGGPGGRAYAGCVALAMAMILRYHQWPSGITRDYVYTDSWGSCTGTFAASAAGLGAYQWGNMPNVVYGTSPIAQRQAVGQLIYHCGVSVQTDYEASGSGAYSGMVPGALRELFLYKVGGLRSRSSYNNAQWYGLIETNLLASRPLYYAFISQNGGHAVVCDGCRNGNELHLNFGWGGYATAWYNMDNVNGGGYTWTQHHVVEGIVPDRVELEVTRVAVESEDDGDGLVEPGESVGLRVWIKNRGGVTAEVAQVRVERRSAWVSVQMPDVQEYVNVAAGAEASNMVLFSLSIDSSCPAGEQEVAVIVEHQGRRWTNGTNISVVRVPHIAVIMSNLVEMVEGEERLLVVSNTGLADLEVRVRELVALGTAGYSWVSNEMSNGLGLVWQDISRIGAAVEVGDNDGMSGMMDVGFMFPLYGKKYQWMSIGANGGIGFTNGTFYYRNRSLPTTTTYAPAVFVAPLWCDLEPLSGGRVWRYSDGFQSIVTWEGVPVYGMNTAVTFQAILRRNGEIEYQYLRSGGIVTNTIGIQGGAGPGGPAVQVAYNQPFVRDGLVVRIRPREEGRVLEIDPEEATVGPGGAAAVKVKCMPLGSGSGAERVIVVVQHNDPRAGPGIVEGTVVIPEGVSGLWFGVVGVWATRRYVF